MRSKRGERRAFERSLRRVVRDREKLAILEPGGAPDRPIFVTSSAVIDGRIAATPCIQCEGEYRILEHAMAGSGLRACAVRCRQCGVGRTLYVAIRLPDEPN